MEMSREELLENVKNLAMVNEQIKNLASVRDRLEAETIMAMQRKGIKRLESTDSEVSAKLESGRTSIDEGIMSKLFKLVSEEELIEKGAYIPVHMVQKRAEFKLKGLNEIIKDHGFDVAEIVADGRIEGVPKLKITRK